MKKILSKIFKIFLVFFIVASSATLASAAVTDSIPVLGAINAIKDLVTTKTDGSDMDMSERMGFTGANSFEQEIKKSINGLTKAISDESTKYRGKLVPDSEKLLGLLSIIAIAFAGVQLAFTSGSLSEPMSRMITTIFTIGLASYLIQTGDNGGYQVMIINGIDGLMNKLASAALPGSATLADGFSNFMMQEFKIVGDVIDIMKDYTIWDWINNGGFTIVLVVFLFLAYLLMSLLGMVATLSALVVVAIALALGPIFIPFLVLEKTSFLFDGWLKFTINACLTKVVIAVLLMIGAAAFNALTFNFASGANSSMAGTLLGALAISGVIGTLMLSAPGIAGAITGGGSIGQDGFAGRMHSAAKGMSRNASVQGSHGVGNVMQKAGSKIGGSSGETLAKIGQRLRSSSTGGAIKGLSDKV